MYISEKTAKKRRMLVTQEDGNTKVVRKRDAIDYHCSTCGVKNIARWRKQRGGAIQCKAFFFYLKLNRYTKKKKNSFILGERCARRPKEV